MMGLWHEEIEAGLEAELGASHFTREAAIAFATAFDPQPFHLDDQAAALSHFGKLAVSGWHTGANWMKHYVAANERARARRAARGEPLPEHGPSPGFTAMRWPKPVHPGDTVTYGLRATAKRPLASRPRWGLAEMLGHGRNQAGELVFSFEAKVLVERRT